VKEMIKKFITSTAITSIALASAAMPAFAQNKPGKIDLSQGADNLGNLKSLQLGAIITTFIKLMVIGAAVLFFVWLVLGGIKWITSGGDKGKTEEARQQITAALVGLVVVFSAWAIAQLINLLFGIDLFALEIKAIPI
jgi:large-conductance mechanosensitive channel